MKMQSQQLKRNRKSAPALGVDVIAVSRVEQAMENPRFAARVFSDVERAFLAQKKHPAQHAAVNFAAKEAFSKALGTGVRGFSLQEVSVLRDNLGAPFLQLEGCAAEIAAGRQSSVALSHDGDIAIAVVAVGESEPEFLPPSPERIARLVKRFGTDCSGAQLLLPKEIELLPLRDAYAHKGTYGRLLNVSGSARYRGAAGLSTEAALRAGAGIACLASVEPVLAAVAASQREPVFCPLPQNEAGSISRLSLEVLQKELCNATAVLAGCGMSNCADTQSVVSFLLSQAKCPLVLDADGLNVLAGRIDILRTATCSEVIITPHIGEMARLTGKTAEEVRQDPIGCAADFAMKNGCVVVLKEADTVVASPAGEVFLNTTGNPGMATGGSGDVLAGIIASFLAQGIAPLDAAKCAVYLHGACGDAAAEEKGEYGLLPGDLISFLPTLLRSAGR